VKSFQVYILAADRAFYEGPCESIIVPTLQGQYGILPNHSNMISAVVPGIIKYKLPGQPEKFAAVSAGLVKAENNEVLVLAASIESPEEIDENRARRAADEAKEEMLQKRNVREYRSAQAHLARAINRLKVKSTYRR
jgi:F-type H+-transporting ATPase subunit epsilon